MDKILRRFTGHEEARAETYRYWHTRPDSEIFEEIWAMSRDAYREWYRMKGIVPHGEGPARSFTKIQRNVRFLIVGGYAYSQFPRVQGNIPA